MPRRTHTDIQDLVAAYALDAVEPDEVEVVEQHLTTCPKCRAELQDMRDTAGYLSYAGTDAPNNLWDRIAGQLEGEPPADATVFPFPTVQDRVRSKKWQRVGMVAASVAAVLIAVNGVLLVRQNQRIENLEPSSISALAERAAADSSSRVVSLRSIDGKATADVVMRPNGNAYLMHTRLPALSAGETYQLWGIKLGKSPVSLSVLGNDPRVVGFTAQMELDQLAITVERAGGASAPTQIPLLTGSLV